MKVYYISILILIILSCKNTIENKLEIDEEKNKIIEVSDDPLIAKLAKMETDTLDCSAKTYWKIVGKGKDYIPQLIESLTDTTSTNIYHGCKKEKLNIGELSYFALEEIGDFPTFIVTNIQFDLISINENGWSCWNFYDYLFDNKNKVEYQSKVRSFYEKSQFEFVEYPDSIITNCMKKYFINGKYEWKEKVFINRTSEYLNKIRRDSFSFDGRHEVNTNANLKSELKYKLRRLEDLENNYQIIKIGKLEIEESIVCHGMARLPELSFERQYFQVNNFDKFKKGISEINFAHIKGTKDMGRKLFPRAKVEELIFKSEELAIRLVEFINKLYVWEDIDKSPSSIFNDKNKVYYISSGGWYMKPFYKEIENKMKN